MLSSLVTMCYILRFIHWFHFREGSLIIQYEVFIPSLNTTKTNLTVLDKNLEKAATNWTNYKEKSVGKIDIEKTKKAFNGKLLLDCTNLIHVDIYCL